MSSIRPNRDQFLALLEAPDEGPVVMLNLLKFKPQSSDGSSTGGEEYKKYGDAAVEMIEARGGKVIWSGRAEQILIEPAHPLQGTAPAGAQQIFIDMAFFACTQPGDVEGTRSKAALGSRSELSSGAT